LRRFDKAARVTAVSPIANSTDKGNALTAPNLSGALPAGEELALAPLFKALADPVRLRLLSMISAAEEGEICVCYLTEAFDLTAPTISYHLKTLRKAGLIHGERRGTWIYYRAVPEMLARLSAVLHPPARMTTDR
jgi:ArsR family transcriptional regulator